MTRNVAILSALAVCAWSIVLGMWLAAPLDQIKQTHACDRFTITETPTSIIIEVPQ